MNSAFNHNQTLQVGLAATGQIKQHALGILETELGGMSELMTPEKDTEGVG
jgi:hypothetical protein